MALGIPQFQTFNFPGAAGSHQRAGSVTALIRELANNYPEYHRFLADEVAKIGRPTRARYADEDSYLAAWARVQELVLAEALLRNCRLNGEQGRALDAAADTSGPPLVRDDRLVGLDDAVE